MPQFKTQNSCLSPISNPQGSSRTTRGTGRPGSLRRVVRSIKSRWGISANSRLRIVSRASGGTASRHNPGGGCAKSGPGVGALVEVFTGGGAPVGVGVEVGNTGLGALIQAASSRPDKVVARRIQETRLITSPYSHVSVSHRGHLRSQYSRECPRCHRIKSGFAIREKYRFSGGPPPR